jgi:hypothetical protein
MSLDVIDCPPPITTHSRGLAGAIASFVVASNGPINVKEDKLNHKGVCESVMMNTVGGEWRSGRVTR